MRQIRLRRSIAGAILCSLGALLTAVPANAQVPFVQADFRGFATGTVMHSDLLQTGDNETGTRIVNSDTAFSGASVDSKGLSGTLQNEDSVVINNAREGKNSFARGSGFEAGVFQGVPVDPNSLLRLGLSESDAPADSSSVSEIPLSLDPAAYASVLRGESAANWDIEGCVLGDDISRGIGFITDLQLVDADFQDNGEAQLETPLVALSSTDPNRAWSQSLSRTRLVPQTAADGSVTGPAFGLSSQVRQTIAPITLFKGTASQLTIEILGEWVLTVTATGLANGAYVHYGPAEESPDTPILRLLDAEGNETRYLTLQDITTDQGLVVDLFGLGTLVIGEDPRAIGGNPASSPTTEANGTLASAAVDVVRVNLGGDPSSITDLRFGHMEASAQVPAGGIACGIKVTKVSDKQQVKAGDEFAYTVVIHNTFDCILTNVKLEDTMSATTGVTFSFVSETPAATSKTANVLNFTLADPLPPGATKEFLVKVKVGADSAAGRMTNTAVATANCGLSAAQAGVEVNTAVVGQVTINVPEVTAADRVLAATGEPDARLWAGILLLAMAAAAALGSMNGRKQVLASRH